jgi:hypothetical protein
MCSTEAARLQEEAAVRLRHLYNRGRQELWPVLPPGYLYVLEDMRFDEHSHEPKHPAQYHRNVMPFAHGCFNQCPIGYTYTTNRIWSFSDDDALPPVIKLYYEEDSTTASTDYVVVHRTPERKLHDKGKEPPYKLRSLRQSRRLNVQSAAHTRAKTRHESTRWGC